MDEAATQVEAFFLRLMALKPRHTQVEEAGPREKKSAVWIKIYGTCTKNIWERQSNGKRKWQEEERAAHLQTHGIVRWAAPWAFFLISE